MAASNEWTEWHLTSSGWVKGSEKDDFQGVIPRGTPEGRVMTMKHSEYAGSVHSGIDRKDEMIWKHPDAELVDSLLRQHGPAPRHL